MLEIAPTLSYVKFDDIKGYNSVNKMRDTLHTIYGGDKNVLRAKAKSLRGLMISECKKVRILVSIAQG